MTNNKSSKKFENFYCKNCNYTTVRESQYSRHLSTRKHQILTNTNKKVPKSSTSYICICGKSYKHASSLSGHKKKCSYQSVENETKNTGSDKEIPNQELELEVKEENTIDYKNMFIQLMKQNQELQTTIIEQQKAVVQQQETINEMIPKIGNNNTTNNNNNNQFNLQLFLNEQCKDALNITDFMKSIEVNMNDLVQTGKLGYVDGMSRIFVNALKDMDVTERPFHCTDIKRETVYIKDQDKWEKDENDKQKIKKTIRNIENKNLQMIPKWQEENPDHTNMDSKKSNEFMELSITALGGEDEKEKSEKKIMKNVLKEVILEKKSQ